MLKCTAVLASLAFAGPGLAQTLTPANPQPAASALAPGLAVSYAYYGVRTLSEAQGKLGRAKPGPALPGLSYLDSSPGERALTSDSSKNVIAAIKGYIRFEAAGMFDLDFISNDGIVAHIGGEQVALLDGVHGCKSAGVQSVKVPQAGWYEVDATYFQRKGTSCLMMDWSVPGDMEPVPDAVFAHRK